MGKGEEGKRNIMCMLLWVYLVFSLWRPLNVAIVSSYALIRLRKRRKTIETKTKKSIIGRLMTFDSSKIHILKDFDLRVCFPFYFLVLVVYRRKPQCIEIYWLTFNILFGECCWLPFKLRTKSLLHFVRMWFVGCCLFVCPQHKNRKTTHKLPWDLTLIVFYVRYLCSSVFHSSTLYNSTKLPENLNHMLHSAYTWRRRWYHD